MDADVDLHEVNDENDEGRLKHQLMMLKMTSQWQMKGSRSHMKYLGRS